MFKSTLAMALAVSAFNQVDGLQTVGIFEMEPRRAQGFDPFVCFADTTQSDVAFIMKRRYSDRASAAITMRDHPSYYEIAKEESMDGSDFRYAVTSGNPQSIGSGFSTAQGQAGATAPLQGAQFAATPVLKYGVLKLDGPSMQRARGNKGSFFDFVTRHADGMLEELGADIAYDLQGDGNGIRGQIATGGISGNVLTLTEQRDVDHFKRGMTIGAATGATGLTGVRVGTSYVTAIDRANKKITLNSVAAIASLAAGDYLFRAGDPGNCIEGMEKCTPLTAPTAGDSFRGVDRSVDVEAFAGVRINNTAIYPDEILGDLAVECQILNKSLTRGVMYPTKFQETVKRLGAKVEYHNPGGNADIGFESFTIHAAGKALKVISDPDCRINRTRAWNPRSHVLKHFDEVVHWIRTGSGAQSQWSTTTDGIEMRSRFHGQYVQYDPSEHGVGAVA